jgi:hypothetical protein
MPKLGPEAARIFRITHIQNVPWILEHGLHCQSSGLNDPNFVAIGMADLIQKRATRAVPLPPGGLLGDYVPFYFTPWSIMMYNIKTGQNGVIQRSNAEIAILVSSLDRLREQAVPFLFTNGHAYMQESEYFTDLANLDQIDWPLLQQRDFKRDPEDPGKLGRYQAEALVHQHVPIEALLGIACYDLATKASLEAEAQKRGRGIPVEIVREWYF